MKLDIQLFADGKVVIDTELNRKNFENGLDKMKSSTQKAGSTIKNIVVGLGITKMISVAMNQITSSIDGAISRYDTLNQFPKVMSNLGIASEEADKSIKKMSEKLAGLPTTLDAGASAVQRFTSKNGDVGKSTDLFLALNNAILAGGAGAEIQASALEQLSQSYAKGKPDMMEWRTAMTAMPAQLKQVAIAMGYVDADELGEALRNGTVSMDEFMDTIVQLNEEGIDGFANFETQARNSTGGIATSIAVAKTQVVKGVADIIDALNTKLGDVGLGGIGDVISNIGKKAKEGLDVIAQLISGDLSISQFMKMGTDSIRGYIDGFISNLPMIIDTAKKVISEFVKGFSQNAPTLINSALDLILALVDGFLDNIDYIIDTGIDLVIGLATGLIEALPRLIEKIPEIITKLVQAIIVNLPKIVDAGLQIAIMLSKGLLEGLANLLLQLPKMLWDIGVAMVKGIGNGISQTNSWLKMRITQMKDKIVNTIKNLPNTMINIGLNIVYGIGNGITNGISWIKNRIREFVGNVTSFIKKMFKIGSPSKLMKDEVGIFLAQGIGVGFEDEIDNVYRSMQNAIDLEQAKLQANVETGRVFNTLQNSTPVAIDINADVEMDGTKVGRLITPVVSKTIKTGGGV